MHPYLSSSSDALLDEPMILREEFAGTREVLMDCLRQRDISPDMLNIAMVLGNAGAIAIAVEEGLGIAFVSWLATARGIALGRLVEVTIEGMELSRNIYMARNRRQPLTRAQAKFWEYVSNSKRQVPSIMFTD